MGNNLVEIKLTRAEFQSLLVMASFAARAARKQADDHLFYSFLKVTNAINKGNPQWTPYEIPKQK